MEDHLQFFTVSSLEHHGGKVKRIKINSYDQGQNVLIVRKVNRNKTNRRTQYTSTLCEHEVGKIHGFPVT